MCRGPRSKSFGLRETAGTKAVTRKEKRKQVRRACEFCRKSKTGCSSFRPCQRCIQHGIADSCVDAPKKRRANAQRSARSEERAKIEIDHAFSATAPREEEWSPSSASSPSEEDNPMMECDVRPVEPMPADWGMAEAPPSALWNYLETIISRDEFTGGEYEEMWAKLTTDEEKWPQGSGEEAQESTVRLAVPTSLASATFTFQSNNDGPSLTWGKDPKVVLPLLHSRSAPRLVTEDSRTIAPLQLESMG